MDVCEIEIYDTLLDNKAVTAVTHLKSNSYMDYTYMSVWSCELVVEKQVVPVYICIPKSWEKDIIDIYVEKYESFPYIPHVDTKGKICLFDLEGVLIDTDLCGLLSQSIERAILILAEGLSGKNKNEFIREFSLYWCQLPDIRSIKCEIPSNQKTQKIKYAELVSKRKQKEKLSAYYKRIETSSLFASYNADSFSIWNINTTQKNASYFFIKSVNYIYPPDAREKLKIEFINMLLRRVAFDECQKVISQSGIDKVFIFEIIQPNEISVCFGVFLKNVFFEKGNGYYQIKNTANLTIKPLSVKRIDKKVLMCRTQDVILNYSKKILLIGCGSIGGYLINELVKAGFEDITMVDDDILTEENIFRHILGIEYVGQYKAEALTTYFKKNIPHIKLKSVDEDIRDLVEEESLNFKDFDLIISATGDHNVNRWINKIVYAQAIEVPIIYLWNEPLDIGCHVAVLQLKYKGCYECFFQRDDFLQELYDSTAYSRANQIITRNLSGCGSSFIPYGSTISLKVVAICMDWISKICDGRYDQNVLISLKGEGFYFEKAGFEVSDVYKGQTRELEITYGKDFCKSNCEVCG